MSFNNIFNRGYPISLSSTSGFPLTDSGVKTKGQIAKEKEDRNNPRPISSPVPIVTGVIVLLTRIPMLIRPPTSPTSSKMWITKGRAQWPGLLVKWQIRTEKIRTILPLPQLRINQVWTAFSTQGQEATTWWAVRVKATPYLLPKTQVKIKVKVKVLSAICSTQMETILAIATITLKHLDGFRTFQAITKSNHQVDSSNLLLKTLLLEEVFWTKNHQRTCSIKTLPIPICLLNLTICKCSQMLPWTLTWCNTFNNLVNGTNNNFSLLKIINLVKINSLFNLLLTLGDKMRIIWVIWILCLEIRQLEIMQQPMRSLILHKGGPIK